MSKILKALSDVKELRKNKYTFALNHPVETTPDTSLEALSSHGNGHSEVNGHTPTKWNNHLSLLIVVIVLGALFTLINHTILGELSKMRTVTSQISKGMSSYDSKLNQLEKGFNNLTVTHSEMRKDFDRQMKSLHTDYKKVLAELEEMSIDTNLLRIKLKEVDATNQRLMDGYINLNNDVKQLRTAVPAGILNNN